MGFWGFGVRIPLEVDRPRSSGDHSVAEGSSGTEICISSASNIVEGMVRKLVYGLDRVR